jgi:hypothetical protein
MKDVVATKQDLDLLRKDIREDIDEVLDLLRGFMTQVSNKFEEYDGEFRKLNKNYDHLLNTIDSFIGRIDRYETEQTARDSQFEKLLVWARKVSEKTGIPLENL